MGVTLKDVAIKAGVSIGTASMALNDSEKVNRETYLKVQKVAGELNYIPNARARALVKQKTNLIALVVPHIINPFFAELAQAVKNKAREENYDIILCSTDGKAEEEKRYMNIFKTGIVDGAIFASQEQLSKESSRVLEVLASKYLPVVNINSQDFASDVVPVIKTDLKNAAYQATRYLIKLGHRKIGFGSRSPRRFEGYKRAMDEHQISFCEFIYYPMENVEEVIQDYLQAEIKPTAFLCYNDYTAIKMVQLFSEKGIRIPEQISIFGTDNIHMARYYNPPLSTVNIPKEKIGREAAGVLIQMIRGEKPKKDNMEIVYPTELVIRKSTASLISEMATKS